MRTNPTGRASTFTQRKRRDQLVDCAIDAIVELGFQGTSVAEVARRAGVSKGVVTYHFAAKDDLIFAVVAEIFDSVKESLELRLRGTSPERFVADYINAWIEYYRTQTRYMLAIREIWGNFRDDGGQQHFGTQAVAGELGVVQQVLEYGQADDSLGNFDARVMAVTIKASLDALLNQLADDPDLDLDAYGAELVSLFERATRKRQA
ncbi:MAG TPA: TetR/AcrR family transcriptional regulator [Solirubrobacteraceae bacterium]|jgi:AcrR family transcriptional regulator